VRPNAATRNEARNGAAIAARDLAAIADLYADAAVTLHHPIGVEYDRDGILTTMRNGLADAGVCHTEPSRSQASVNPRARSPVHLRGQLRRVWPRRRSCRVGLPLLDRGRLRGRARAPTSSRPIDSATRSRGCTSATPSFFPKARSVYAPPRMHALPRCWGHSSPSVGRPCSRPTSRWSTTGPWGPGP
jgi:hypothetical protein